MAEYNLPSPRPALYDGRAYARFELGARFLRQGEIVVLDRLHGRSCTALVHFALLNNSAGR